MDDRCLRCSRSRRRRRSATHRTRAGHSPNGRMIWWHREFDYIHQLDVKDQVSLGRNPRMRRVRTRTSACTVCQLPGDENAALAANLHAFKSLVPAWNYATKALREADGLRIALLRLSIGIQHRLAVLVQLRSARMVVGAAKLAPIDGQPTDIEDLVHLVGLGIGARADLDVLVAQGEGSLHYAFGRRNAVGQLDPRRHGGLDGRSCGRK